MIQECEQRSLVIMGTRVDDTRAKQIDITSINDFEPYGMPYAMQFPVRSYANINALFTKVTSLVGQVD